jgi:hypothetical protein
MGSATADRAMGRFGASLSQFGATEARTGVPDEIPSCDPVVIAASSNYRQWPPTATCSLAMAQAPVALRTMPENLPAQSIFLYRNIISPRISVD